MRLFDILTFITCGVATALAGDNEVSTANEDGFIWVVPQAPEQIHVGPYDIQGDNNKYVFRWATALPKQVVDGSDPVNTYAPVVNIWHYGDVSHNEGLTFEGRSWLFHDPGSKPGHFNQLFHEVIVDLTLIENGDTRYYRYMVGDRQFGYSSIMMLETLPQTLLNHEPLKLLLYGDLGWENAVALPLIEERMRNEHFHAAVHIGDFAYDFDTANGTYGDHFMRSIQSIASRMPYLVTMGNHEAPYDFFHYLNRFTQPYRASNSTSPMFWSMDMPHVHFVSFSSELYYFTNETAVREQWEWLDADLAAVNRTDTPWVIVMSHRPMYCFADDKPCNVDTTRLLSDGLIIGNNTDGSVERKWGLEELVLKYDVDLYVAGHVHSYERHWPTRRGQAVITDGVSLHVYENPQAPVHWTVGNAGNKGGINFFESVGNSTAVQYEGYGYSVVEITRSKIQFRLYQAPSNELFDYFTIVKTCSDDNPWTIAPTGAPCWFDNDREDCAKCIDGGCQCDRDRPNVCVQCGDDEACAEAAPCENFF
eukprot:Clim_evm2s7 gene=Clim_evmTU2s7